jgi:hypothetical protein
VIWFAAFVIAILGFLYIRARLLAYERRKVARNVAAMFRLCAIKMQQDANAADIKEKAHEALLMSVVYKHCAQHVERHIVDGQPLAGDDGYEVLLRQALIEGGEYIRADHVVSSHVVKCHDLGVQIHSESKKRLAR